MAKREKQDTLVSHKFLPIFDALAKKGKTQAVAELAIAILRYDIDGTEPVFSDDSIWLTWEGVIKPYMDENTQAYYSVGEKRRRAVNMRYEQNDNMNTNDTNEYKSNVCIQNDNMNTNVHDNDNDNDNDNGDELKEEVQEEIPGVCEPQPVRLYSESIIISAWNRLPLPNILSIRGKRKAALTARIKEFGEEQVMRAIHNIENSPFLLGNNKSGWQITFDWFVRPNNFQKVLEGNYLARDGTEIKDEEDLPFSEAF